MIISGASPKGLRKSVPTDGVARWWECGWAYVMPDFDTPNHSIIEWLSDKPAADPDAEQLADDVLDDLTRRAG